MRFTTLFFDLDGTLYPESSGLWDAIRERMDAYLHLRMGFPQGQIPSLRRHYYQTYGTTLRGLQADYQVDGDDYLAYVHDLPLESYLGPDPGLRSQLISFPQEKWIFTNADDRHAQRVLAVLGLEDCFTGIIDVRALDFLCKPDIRAYNRALSIAGEPDPRRCALFDDSARNLAAARELGFFTILVGGQSDHADVDRRLLDLHDLSRQLPELLDRTPRWKERGHGFR